MMMIDTMKYNLNIYNNKLKICEQIGMNMAYVVEIYVI